MYTWWQEGLCKEDQCGQNLNKQPLGKINRLHMSCFYQYSLRFILLPSFQALAIYQVHD